MIIPKSLEEIAHYIETEKTILFFTADWCGDCVFIKPHLPEIVAEFPDFKFLQIDRDEYIDLCQQWDVFGIPSFIAVNDGKEIGRFVSKDRKTKEEITNFLINIAANISPILNIPPIKILMPTVSLSSLNPETYVSLEEIISPVEIKNEVFSSAS